MEYKDIQKRQRQHAKNLFKNAIDKKALKKALDDPEASAIIKNILSKINY